MTFHDFSYQKIKEYCSENGLKIGWFADKTLLHYINEHNKTK